MPDSQMLAILLLVTLESVAAQGVDISDTRLLAQPAIDRLVTDPDMQHRAKEVLARYCYALLALDHDMRAGFGYVIELHHAALAGGSEEDPTVLVC